MCVRVDRLQAHQALENRCMWVQLRHAKRADPSLPDAHLHLHAEKSCQSHRVWACVMNKMGMSALGGSMLLHRCMLIPLEGCASETTCCSDESWVYPHLVSITVPSAARQGQSPNGSENPDLFLMPSVQNTALPEHDSCRSLSHFSDVPRFLTCL